MNALNKHSHLPLPLWGHLVRSDNDILLITLQSFTKSILSKLRFSSFASLSCVFVKNNNFSGVADVKWKKKGIDRRRRAAILPIAEKKTDKISGSDGIWTKAPGTLLPTEPHKEMSTLPPLCLFTLIGHSVAL